MEHFINETIDISSLPKFEEAKLSPLQKRYWLVIVINIIITFLIIAAIVAAALYFIEEIQPYWLVFGIAYFCLLAFVVLVKRIGFLNKGYAFRTHDMIYKSGAIAVTTTVIPYNRIQHAAMHEGFISRKMGLSSVEVFTAGGINSEVKISGIEKTQAERIKGLLMGKVLKEDEANEGLSNEGVSNEE